MADLHVSPHTSRACSLLFFALASSTTAQSRYADVGWDESRLGSNGIPAYAQAVSGIGDVDGDGVGDVLLGSPVQGGFGQSPRVVLRSGRSGRVLFVVENDLGLTGFARTVDCAGDLDGDAVEDFFVGSLTGQGALYSGRDGSVLGMLPSASLGIAPTHFGRMPDLNGDGRPEMLVGNSNTFSTRIGCCSWSSSDAGIRRVQLLDGATGTVLLEVHPSTVSAYGSVLGAVGDVDGDGLEDFGVGAGVLDPMGYIGVSGAGPSGFDVYGSVSGALLWSVPVVVTEFQVLDDLDADGVADLALGGMPDASSVDSVQIRSGKTGALLRTYTGRGHGDGFGLELATCDWNRDGSQDLIVGANERVGISSSFAGTFFNDADGYVEVIDLKNDRVLRVFEGSPEDWGLGAAVVGIGDATGDGMPDLAALAAWSDVHPAGTLRVLSQSPLRIASSSSEVSIASGASLTFHAKLGAGRAGDVAILVGSATGPTPGTLVGGVTIPLVPDPYTRFLFGRVRPILLDANGEGSVSLRIPPGVPQAAIGRILDHGFIVFDARTKALVDASWSLPVSFTK